MDTNPERQREVGASLASTSGWFQHPGRQREVGAWFQHHLEPDDLFLVSYAAEKGEPSESQKDCSFFPAGSERRALIRQLLQQTASVLICPESWKSSLSRMLLLYRSREQNDEMLTTVMDLCRRVRATPVVLTVAGSEREGWRRQQPARAAFAEHGQSGNFDLLIGSEVAEAAIRVARWRQCQLVIMGRYGRPPWTHWFGGSTTERLLGLAESRAVLTFPKKGASASDPDHLFSGAPKGSALGPARIPSERR